MVGRKGLEPSQIALSVPKTDASTNSAIAPQFLMGLYIIETICPTTIIENYIIITLLYYYDYFSMHKYLQTDPKTGYCYGCGRTIEERKIWKLEKTTDQWKKENLEIIQKRLTGWQLESFVKSYTYKIENGISLFKKNLKNE